MTRNTTQENNALDALQAARSTMRAADKTTSDALSIVEKSARETGAVNAATTPGTQHTRRISAHSPN